MSSFADTLADELETLVDESVAALDEYFGELMASAGPRPLWTTKANRLEQLEAYLATRDDEGAWMARYDEWAGEMGGMAAAQAHALREAARMEKSLAAFGGPRAVYAALAAKRLGQAERTLRDLERLEARPKLKVSGPLRPVDPLDALSMAAGLPPEPVGMGDWSEED